MITAKVRCSGRIHRIELRDGALRLLDHEDHEGSALRVLDALAPGAGECRCLEVVEAWDRASVSYDRRAEKCLPRALVPHARARCLEASASEPYEAAIVNAQSVKPRGCPVSVQIYELRLYGRDRCPTRTGKVPRGFPDREVLGRVCSGHGVPLWMDRAEAAINMAEPTSVRQAYSLMQEAI